MPSLAALLSVVDERRLFWRVFAATALFKLVAAAAVPLTGDEAYFVIWGNHPDYGYYDHGAMTGWWIWLALLAGQNTWIVRLPAVFTSLAAALVLRQSLRPVDAAKADLAATLFLLSPVNVLSFLITTDTSLLFFSVLAGAWAFRAARRDSTLDWFVAGLFLGLAFLSKYFAVLLGISLGAVVLFGAGGRRRVAGFLALAAGVVPGVAVNVAWNFNHGWVNVVFNIFNRNKDAGFSLVSALVLLLSVVAVVGPGVAWFLLRPRAEGRLPWPAAWKALRESRVVVYFAAAAIPFAVLWLVSFFQDVGLHWLISFQPFVFPALTALFGAEVLRRMLKPMAVYALVLAGLVAAVSLAVSLPPVALLKNLRAYPSIVLGSRTDEVLAAVEPYAAEYRLTSPSYAQAGLLAFHRRAPVPVIGPGSYHAREDDLITNWREFDGRNLMILTYRKNFETAAAPWFDAIEQREVTVRGARFQVILGRGFRYAAYREDVLRPIADRYYVMPSWLERFAAPSFFRVRYALEQGRVCIK